MNEHIFQSYIDNITQYYGVNQSYIFNEGKERSRTEPRQMFFYLCHKKGIPIVSVQSFLEKNNFWLHHATILQGVKKMENVYGQDEDYSSLIKRMEKIREYV